MNYFMDFFDYEHLPPHLQVVSKPFGDLARTLNRDLPEGFEKDFSLRKLLESKDCAVRAVVLDQKIKQRYSS